MEQKIIVAIISTVCTICVGLVTNYISDKLKSHSVRKSDFEVNFKSKHLEFKVKSKKR